ncbi:pleiotropic drug resistance protein 2 [Quercus suber]|uniref:Pleiotropic drug resistance protein 2 n=1 Tax=Quercus suber TaxID=58331 RepID=A0AAW0M3M2_QUESU
MAAAMAGDELVRSMSSKRMSSGHPAAREAGPHRACMRLGQYKVMCFRRVGGKMKKGADVVALERLPTYDRLRKGMLKQVLDNGRIGYEEIDVTNLGVQDKKHLIESLLKVAEEDDEKLLRRIRDRTDR